MKDSHLEYIHIDGIIMKIIFGVISSIDMQKKLYIDKVMYIYLLNKESLMRKISYSNILEIKSTIYLEEMNYKLFGRQIGLGKFFLNRVNGFYRAAARADRDIPLHFIKLVYISIYF